VVNIGFDDDLFFDYCFYLVAKGLEKNDIASKYFKRSQNWQNLWKHIEDNSAKGFLMPKDANGKWDEDYKGRKWDSEKGWIECEFSVHNGGTCLDYFYEAPVQCQHRWLFIYWDFTQMLVKIYT